MNFQKVTIEIVLGLKALGASGTFMFHFSSLIWFNQKHIPSSRLSAAWKSSYGEESSVDAVWHGLGRAISDSRHTSLGSAFLRFEVLLAGQDVFGGCPSNVFQHILLSPSTRRSLHSSCLEPPTFSFFSEFHPTHHRYVAVRLIEFYIPLPYVS